MHIDIYPCRFDIFNLTFNVNFLLNNKKTYMNPQLFIYIYIYIQCKLVNPNGV